MPENSSQAADNSPDGAPWYESNVLWGGIGIVCTVVAAMKHNLLWMLWFAWLCFMFNVWSIGRRYHRRRWLIWICGVLIVSVGLFELRNWLSTSQGSSPPATNVPTRAEANQPRVEPAPTNIPKPRSVRPKHAVAPPATSIAQSGSGNQQTVTQAPITQSNSGGCNQQVIGGNGNTNNCEGPKLTITDDQFKKIRDAMVPYAGHTVEILIPNQTVESYAYGKRLAAALNAADLKADPHPLMTTAGCDGGISFGARTQQDFIPVLARVMQLSGAVKGTIKQGGVWIDPADLYITVCPYQ